MTKRPLSAGILPLCELTRMPADTPVLLAFSGGADSVALLHLLAQRSREDGFSLTLAHVNHGIRGEEAERDAAFCQREAERLGLEICVLNADVPSLAEQNGHTLEEEARNVRYAFFEEVMREREIPVLATAHHADDQLETVLFRLCRGTGLRGLGGIPPTRPFANGVLVRPLLQYTKEEILAFCREKVLDFVTDSTNADTAYTRNRLRAEVVPVLGESFAGVRERVGEMCRSLREDEEYLFSLAVDFLHTHGGDEGLSKRALLVLPAPVRRRVLAEWIRRACDREPEAVHLRALEEMLQGRGERFRVALACTTYAFCEGDRVCLTSERRAPVSEAVTLPFALGESDFGSHGIRIEVAKTDEKIKIHNLSIRKCINLTIDFDIIKNGLFWRTPRAGDRILMGGMHRRLCKLFAKAEIPPLWRDRMPILCDGEGIVWAPGVGLRDGVRKSESGVCFQILFPAL